MGENELDAARQLLREALPAALCDVMTHYRNHFRHDTPEAVKEFNAFHAAGKNALSHMQLLLKIYNMIGSAQQMENLQGEIADVIAELEGEDA